MGTETSETEIRGISDPVAEEYFDWDPDGSPVSIHMHLDAVDGITRDVLEGFGTLPRCGLEVGGLLLGRVLPGIRPVVWIERYQPVSCNHRFGPHFILDSEDTAGLEREAAGILDQGEFAVVGLYRSHTRPGFQLENSDFELIRRYFSDSSDLVLLIRAENASELAGQFQAWEPGGGAHPIGEEFPLRGRVFAAGILADGVGLDAVEPEVRDDADDEQDTRQQVKPAAISPEPPRRLVPDFAPATPVMGRPPIEPAPSLYGLSGSPGLDDWQEEDPPAPGPGERVKKWWPLLAALLLVGGILWFLLQPGRRGLFNPGAAQTAETSRPLGLYVDPLGASSAGASSATTPGTSSAGTTPSGTTASGATASGTTPSGTTPSGTTPSGTTWRVLWNPNATALHDARTVQLFVREGDEQNRIDLSPRDLASGSYEYHPVGEDVTFRLEVVNRAGQVSAESFRLMRKASLPGPGLPSPAVGAVAPAAAGEGAEPAGRLTPPKVIYRAPPVVAAGIRPRIKGSIQIDVRVHIDARGRVVAASPVAKQHSGLEQYLAGRAVQAARLWRFEPARDDGKAVAGTQTIHFVFDK